MKTSCNVDVIVIGAGFSGSLTALGLRQIGYDVALVEKSSHPRFAIGESSTPIADLILRDLSDRYNLPWLRDISRYGSWQQKHPEITCGLKRGFSYYKHTAGQPFETDGSHSNELLVTASKNDRQSDTNWFRSDVDAFFVQKVKQTGIPYWDKTNISSLHYLNQQWEVQANRIEKELTFKSRWLIDATGSNSILDLLDVPSTSTDIRTHTSAIFSHFSDVEPWQNRLHKLGISSSDYPYNPDHSALHHLLEEGWLWMLRFNNGITSAGIVFNKHQKNNLPAEKQARWAAVLKKYPSLKTLFKDATIVNPPNQLIQTTRLQRRAAKAAGRRWITLPHTAGFIDPLHSTGIAHSLSGVERILHAFETGKDHPRVIDRKIPEYEKAIFAELDFIDLLVDGCYRSMPHFELFHIYSTLYFTAAIQYEQKRLTGRFNLSNDLFLSADNDEITGATQSLYKKLKRMFFDKSLSEKDIQSYWQAVETAISPYNDAGLLDPQIPGMYRHTKADF